MIYPFTAESAGEDSGDERREKSKVCFCYWVIEGAVIITT